MYYLKRALHFLLAVWFALATSVSFVLVFPALYVTLRAKKNYPLAQRIRRSWSAFSLQCGGIKVIQIEEEAIDKSKTYVITSNHTSKLDMMTLHSKLGIDIVFMANAAFASIPLFGMFFRTIDVAVSFTDRRKSAIAYRKALSLLKEGTNVAVYPEATISRITPKLSPFKNGAFRLAIEAQVDIIPVTCINHWNLLPDENIYYFSPGKVIQFVHKPISTKGMTIHQTEELKQQVFNTMANKLAEYGYHP